MIGYYVHHHGRGHASRATAIAAAAGDERVTVLSSAARPADFAGDWVLLARDDGGEGRDVEAGGRLHWVPLGHAGLRSRMAAIAAWIEANRPSAFVVDVSVEVAVLARLLGVPVVTVMLPGDRSDRPHTLGFDLADTVLACWPPGTAGMASGLTASAVAKLREVGAISRFRRTDADPRPRPGTVLVLGGAGGGELDPDRLDAARRSTPGWSWTVLDGTPAHWVDDPWPLICAAEVVITHAGQNAIADVAAAGRPAIVLAQDRPHGEQQATARALAADRALPVVVLDELPEDGWEALLAAVAGMDGGAWRRWNDGMGAERAARIIDGVARSSERAP